MLKRLQESNLNSKLCQKIFEILAAAQRPLRVDELAEVLSITPGDTKWDISKLINNIHKALTSCGSFIVVDEELSTVHFAHSSVKRHILSTPDVSDIRDYHVDYFTAEIEFGKAIVTYLNLDVLSGKLRRLETGGLSQHHAAGIPGATVSSALPDHDVIKKLAISLLRSRRKPDLDLATFTESSVGLAREDALQKQDSYAFLPYCQEYWLFHTQDFHQLSSDSPVYSLWEALVDGRVSTVVLPWSCETQDDTALRIVRWIVNNHHTALWFLKMKQLCVEWLEQYRSDYHLRSYLKQMELLLRLPERNIAIQQQICSIRQADAILLDAVRLTSENVAHFALKLGADVNKLTYLGKSGSKATALIFAVESGSEAMVRLFLENGAELNAKHHNISSPLLTAASVGNTSMIRLLLVHGADPNMKAFNPKIGKTTVPLIAVLDSANEHTLSSLHTLCSMGADLNAFDDSTSSDWRTPLEYAIYMKRYVEAKALFNRGAIIHRTDNGSDLSRWAISSNDHEFVESLLDRGVKVYPLGDEETLSSISKCRKRFKTTSEVAVLLHSAYTKQRGLTT